MFMIEKPLLIIIFVYGSCFMILTFQYAFGDVMHMQITNFQGVPLKNNLFQDIKLNTINSFSNKLYSTNSTFDQLKSVATAAEIGWDLFLLMTGLYIFDIMFQLGVPLIFVTSIGIIYIFMLARTVIGLIRGI